MNRKKHRLLPAIAPMLLALSFLTSGCVEPLDPSQRGPLDPDAVSLPIRLYIPNAIPATKAGAGDVSGVSPESQVYRVQVWMFDHHAANETAGDGEKAVAYAEADLSTSNTQNIGPYEQSGYYPAWESSKIFRLPLMIPGYVLEREAVKMKFDFYVLANAASIGSTAGRETTRGALKDLTFGGDWFGTATPKTGTTPAIAINGSEDAKGPGLPISGFFNKTKDTGSSAESPYVGPADGVDLSFLKPETLKDLTPAQITAKSPVVQLERAISKIRFAFARPTGMTGIQITRIEIGQFNGTDPKTASVTGGLIPKTTFVFPREDGTDFELPSGSSGVEYDASVATIGSDDNPLFNVPLNYSGDDPIIAVVSDPKALESTSETVFTKPDGSTENKSYYGYAPNGMSAQRYSDLLDDFTTSQIVYFRETDKPVQGKIYFKLTPNGSELSAPFYMPAQPNTETNFHRNHSWIVYAYFQGSGLFIKPVLVQDWFYKDNNQYFEYEQDGEAHLVFSDKSQSLFGYGYSSSTANSWYTEGKHTEWYFRRQSWDSAGHEYDASQPVGVSSYDWDDWVHSQMVVAPGKNTANVPFYANRIELVTSYFSVPLYLKLSNPTDFSIVLYHTESNSYDVISGSSGAEIPSNYYVEAGETKHRPVRSYFYVVPNDTATPGAETGVYLMTGTDTSHSTPMKLPFNSNAFPGSRDYTEVYFYCVDPATFKGYYSDLPVNVKAYDKNGVVDIF